MPRSGERSNNGRQLAYARPKSSKCAQGLAVRRRKKKSLDSLGCVVSTVECTLRALRPARKIGDDVRQRIGDQLNEPNHRDPKIVLPHEVNDAPEYHKQRPDKPVESDRTDSRHETFEGPGIYLHHVDD